MAIKFSIIIPAYNLEDYLSDCLQSIQAQTFDDIEVLIVDDGSTDGTGRVAQDFADRDSRFKVLRKENGGVSSARNLGLDRAVGEFVWFIDGDDYIHPESLAWLNHLFEESPAADYVTFGYDWTKKRHDGDFPSLESLCHSQPQYFDCSTQEGFENALRYSPIAVCCVCYRRDIINESRFQSLSIGEDRLYALQVCFSAKAVIYTETSIYCYYQRLGSAAKTVDISRIFDLCDFGKRILQLAKLKGGQGKPYLSHLYLVELFPGIMRYLACLSGVQKREGFLGLIKLMKMVDVALGLQERHWRFKSIIETESYLLAWVFFNLRFKLRRAIIRCPILISVLQKIKQPRGN